MQCYATRTCKQQWFEIQACFDTLLVIPQLAAIMDVEEVISTVRMRSSLWVHCTRNYNRDTTNMLLEEVAKELKDSSKQDSPLFRVT
jgi:hypothetical protein